MNKIFFLKLSDDIAAKTAEYIAGNFKSFDRTAVVSGGKRPALFIRRHIFEKTSGPFFSPAFFSNDEFMEHIAGREAPFKKLSELDACFAIYEIMRESGVKTSIPGDNFAGFLPWAREMLSIFERSGLENIEDEAFRNIEKLAGIGYSVPAEINSLLSGIASIREKFYGRMERSREYTRGYIYRKAARIMQNVTLEEFDAVIFCGLFHPHRTEIEVARALMEKDKAVLFFQGDPEDWSALEDSCKALGITPGSPGQTPLPALNLHAAFDLHSQTSGVREVLDRTDNKENTVIVLAEPSALIPLAYEISDSVGECNISMGYPVQRSMFCSLLISVIKARETSRRGSFYSKDYLRVLSHPFVKNLDIRGGRTVSRIIIHKIEEALKGMAESAHSGKIFITEREIEESEEIISSIKEALDEENIILPENGIKEALGKLHSVLFGIWERVVDFASLASAMEELFKLVIAGIEISKYPVEKGAAAELLSLKDELRRSSFSELALPFEDISKIFMDSVKTRRISLPGAPLKGLQVLGFLETRLLKFKNVIILDLNEGVLPGIKINEPLIPSEVLRVLEIKDITKEEQTQRYHLRRLFCSAENVDIFYQKNSRKERSRFIEELIWEEEKKRGQLAPFPERTAVFSLRTSGGEETGIIEKTDEEIRFLRSLTYSATSLNTYIACPMKFYYKYVQGLKEAEDMLAEPEGVDVGRFIHDLLENTFARFTGKKPVIDENFRKYFYNYSKKFFKSYFENRLGAGSFMLERVIEHRMERFLQKEEERVFDRILSLEEKISGSIFAGETEAKLTARVDRTDEINSMEVLIIDYKTGAGDSMPARSAILNPLMEKRDEIKKQMRSVQLPLYIHLARGRHPGRKINACLYNLRNAELKHLFKGEDADNEEAAEGFSGTIENIIGEILDPETPFAADAGGDSCRYCPYGAMCG